MVDSVQQIMILGTHEAQIMLLPDHIDLCADRLSQITNLKVSHSIIFIDKKINFFY
jgi:hypothetical protein